MEIVSKITMRTIAGGEVKALLGNNDSVDFAQIIGFATAEIKGDKPTQFGDNVWIAGEFKAQNLTTGTTYYAPKLYAPELMHNIISAQLHGEPDSKVQFAFVVGIKKSKAVIGYEYTLKSLIEPKDDNNPFAAIENKIKGIGNIPNPGGVIDPSQITM